MTCCFASFLFLVVGSLCLLLCFNIARITNPLVALLIMNHIQKFPSYVWARNRKRRNPEKEKCLDQRILLTPWVNGQRERPSPCYRAVEKREVGTSQETKAVREFPLLSISTAWPEVNTTGCSPELRYGANPARCWAPLTPSSVTHESFKATQ